MDMAAVPGSRDEPFYELLHPHSPSPSPPNASEDAHTHTTQPGFDPPAPSSAEPVMDASHVESADLEASISATSLHDKVYSAESSKTRDCFESRQVAYDTVTVAAIEQTMKKYSDNILRVLEGINGRLSQLESDTQDLERTVGNLEEFMGENQREVDDYMRKLESLLKEVQSGVVILSDKQEKTEAQFEHLRLQLLDSTIKSKVLSTSASHGLQQPHAESLHQPLASPPLYIQQPPVSTSQMPLQPEVSLLSKTGLSSNLSKPVAPIQQQLHAASPSQNAPPAPNMQQMPPPESAQQPFYSQQSRQQQVSQGPYSQLVEANPYGVTGSQMPHPVSTGSHRPELPQYAPENYPRVAFRHFMPSQQPPQQPPMQQHGTIVPQGYESGQGRPASTIPFPQAYYPESQMSPHDVQSGGYSRPPYWGLPVPSGSGGFPQLPTARSPHLVMPMSGRGGGISGGNTNRTPIDQVIENVAAMGFPRDQVRAVVKNLTESGQSADPNAVLDKLMRGEIQLQKGWIRQ